MFCLPSTFLRSNGSSQILVCRNALKRPLLEGARWFTVTTSSSMTASEVLRLQREGGSYKLVVPLPSQGQQIFTLPDEGPVRNFLDVIRIDDPTVERVGLYDTEEVRISSSVHTTQLVQNDFKLKINDTFYLVHSPVRTRVVGKHATVALSPLEKTQYFQSLCDFLVQKSDSQETLPYSEYIQKAKELGLTETKAKESLAVMCDMGLLLYFSSNIELHSTIFLNPSKLSSVVEKALNLPHLRRTMDEKMALVMKLRHELSSLEKKRNVLQSRAERTVKIVSWSVLAGLTAQALLFARLVWWDYDWGIMEPVTWFTGVVEMTIGAYIYHLLTCKEYSNTQMANVVTEWRFNHLCKIHEFDLKRYSVLIDRIKEIEAEIHTGEKLQVV